jgi:hypothetical protein
LPRFICHFANRRFAWQTAKSLSNKDFIGQFANLPTPLSGANVTKLIAATIISKIVERKRQQEGTRHRPNRAGNYVPSLPTPNVRWPGTSAGEENPVSIEEIAAIFGAGDIAPAVAAKVMMGQAPGPRIKSTVIFREALKKTRDRAKDGSGVFTFHGGEEDHVCPSFPKQHSHVFQGPARSPAPTQAYQASAA